MISIANCFKRSLLSTFASAAEAIGPEPVRPPGRFYMSINLFLYIEWGKFKKTLKAIQTINQINYKMEIYKDLEKRYFMNL